MSGSMAGSRLTSAKTGLMEIVYAMRPNDRLSILTFDDSPFFSLKPRPVEEILRKNELPGILERIFARGQTALYDAIYATLNQIRDKTRNTKILVLTDGLDNASKVPFVQVLAALSEYPNITLDILHVANYPRVHVANYQELCEKNRGAYQVITEIQFQVTIGAVFRRRYFN